MRLNALVFLLGCSFSVACGGSMVIVPDDPSDDAGTNTPDVGPDRVTPPGDKDAGTRPDADTTKPDPPPPGGEWEHLQQMKARMVGTWRGSVTSPWTPPKYEVEITFRADGRYSARCLGTEACLPFHYGSAAETPLHTWDLVDVQANREAVGTLYVWERPGSWVGDLKKVTLYGEGARLTFEFWNASYGPLRYDLYRAR
jgi:hypothetical protein